MTTYEATEFKMEAFIKGPPKIGSETPGKVDFFVNGEMLFSMNFKNIWNCGGRIRQLFPRCKITVKND